MNSTFFPSRTEARPMIYAYEEDNPNFRGCLKVGFASSGVEKRVAEQFPILKPGKSKPYRIVFAECAMYDDGGSFTDKRIHAALEAMGVKRLYAGSKKTECFRCWEIWRRRDRESRFCLLSSVRSEGGLIARRLMKSSELTVPLCLALAE